MLMDRFGAYLDSAERERALSELYGASYERSATVFRPGAREVLERLLGTGVPVFVVTNSGTEAVTRKVLTLLPASVGRPEVRGNAMKAFIEEPERTDPSFAALPETQTLAGLSRPVYLRRGRYYEVLRGIWERTGTLPERTLLVGDIYELDLAMPLHLGVSIHLIVGENTAEYERAFVEAHERGGSSRELHAVLDRVGIR
jgi:FMN phosphatase YigB (HAD superfamily)